MAAERGACSKRGSRDGLRRFTLDSQGSSGKSSSYLHITHLSECDAEASEQFTDLDECINFISVQLVGELRISRIFGLTNAHCQVGMAAGQSESWTAQTDEIIRVIASVVFALSKQNKNASRFTDELQRVNNFTDLQSLTKKVLALLPYEVIIDDENFSAVLGNALARQYAKVIRFIFAVFPQPQNSPFTREIDFLRSAITFGFPIDYYSTLLRYVVINDLTPIYNFLQENTQPEDIIDEIIKVYCVCVMAIEEKNANPANTISQIATSVLINICTDQAFNPQWCQVFIDELADKYGADLKAVKKALNLANFDNQQHQSRPRNVVSPVEDNRVQRLLDYINGKMAREKRMPIRRAVDSPTSATPVGRDNANNASSGGSKNGCCCSVM